MNEPRLFLHTSNRMEHLAVLLAQLLNKDRGDPFDTETVLVQSRGMGRWLSLQLADTLGICLNVRFPFPRDVVDEILRTMLPGWEGAPGFRREALVWKIFRLLDEFRADRRFRPIVHYLEGDDLLKRIQLADRLANLFDQYLMYRPDWLIEWERKEGADWQAVLWRRLAEEAPGELHLARAWQALRAVDDGEAVDSDRLPRRLCVFGISSLPPLFLDVLQAYARRGEVHLFLLQPTDQYWGDLVSKNAQARMASGSVPPLYLEEGHPLVASLGRQGQDLLNLLIDADFQQAEDWEAFVDAGGNSLLRQVQTDILQLTDRQGSDAAKIEVRQDDVSIQVHSCHSPMREVEVLRDQLLDLFQKDPSLQPRDVLVMIPDIETYAPYVQAVFGSVEDERSRIPFSVVDRRPRSEHHAIDAWFRLLDLAGSRFGARDVLALIETTPFRSRFGLGDRDVNCLRTWIQASGIRWGVDAFHRQEQGLPPVPETTWQCGIDQWLLGYAMRARNLSCEATELNGVFPFDEIEGSNIALLDRFLAVLDFLFQTHERLKEPRPLDMWCDVLGELQETLFRGLEEVAQEADAIRSTLNSLRQVVTLAEARESLPLEVIRYFLEKAIDDTVSSGGFLSGGVTFCTLQPMRTIPARVVCLVGMNDDAFPRRQQQLGFDRMRDKRRIGDRSPREDDRYLFLETLLSARENLLLSYIGQSARDLSEAPPSVLVSELLDYLNTACAFPGGKDAREFLVRRHRLQPFHPDYFLPGRLFSYSAENLAACRRLMGEQREGAAFVRAGLAEPEPEWRTLTVQQLVRFFRNPAQHFVKERLGLRLPQEETMLEDSEMFRLDPLLEYQLRKDSVDARIEKREAHEWQRLQAGGRVPLGTPGMAACLGIQRDADKFAVRLSQVMDDTTARSNRAVDLRIGEFHLIGELGPFVGTNLVLYRPATLKARDLAGAWIQHLVACCAGEVSATIVMGEDGVVTLPPLDDAGQKLPQLLDLYWKGLYEPLPFFPEAAWAYCLKSGDKEAALEAARKVFAEPSDFRRTEMDDRYVSFCWSGSRMEEAIGETFAGVAETVFSGFELLNAKGDSV